MDTAFFFFFIIIIFALIFIGFLLNGFIFLKNVIDGLRGRHLQASDMIMASLGLVRIFHLILYTLKNLLLVSPEVYNIIKTYADYILTTLMFVEFCSLWWGMVLCVFYCLKITNYSSKLFIKLKMRISRMVPWLLLGSMLVSLLSCLPCRWGVLSFHKLNSTNIYNETRSDDIRIHANYARVHIISIAGSFLPFIIFCVATFFLVVPLFKHTRNMSHNNSGSTKGHLDVHLSAIRNMLSFFVFFVVYFINGILFPISVQVQNFYFVLSCCFFQVCYPSLHSVVLIISNVKLKQSITEALRCVK